MTAKDEIMTTRGELHRDLTEDEETMIYNAYESGKRDGFNNCTYGLMRCIENKQRENYHKSKRKEYSDNDIQVKYNECDQCDRLLPESECCNRQIGDDIICICDKCLQNNIDIGFYKLDFKDESDGSCFYYLTKDGKESKIRDIQRQIQGLNSEIDLLQREIRNNCKDATDLGYLEMTDDEDD